MLRRGAVERGDAEAAGAASLAIERLLGRVNRDKLQATSLARSAEELFGARVTRAISEGYARGRALEHRESDITLNQHTIDALKAYYAPGQERATLASALTVDGCFEVGGALSPVRIREQFVRQRLVPYPTQVMKLERATQPEDIPKALITDPRSIIMDLAAGRLLTRRHLRDDVATRTRTVMQGEVRVYVLDGSSSMIGHRARMRDAILTAELATLIKRMENPRANARVVLYYRYFTRQLGDVHRVDSVGGAVEAIRDVTGTARTGGTNIERALLASMTMINEARASDPELACGQIVLITDGESPVGEVRISQARAALDVPVGISVIALGEENHALRRIVAAQRKQGERAFYHFLPDAYLQRVAAGDIDDELAVHASAHPSVGARAAPMPAELRDALGELVEQLGDLQRCREREARRELERADHHARHDDHAEASSPSLFGEGQRARLEALYNDELAVQRRFRRWFPPSQTPGAGAEAALQHLPPQPGTLERDDLDAVIVVLATVADVVEAVGATPIGRMADAVDMLDRLLPNARLTPARYHELLRLYPGELAEALQAVHGTTRSGLGWRIDNLPQRRAPLLPDEQR